MEAMYQWIRQIAVFAVISFLVLYLMGDQQKKYTLKFYLSLLMLLLILKPAAAFLNLDQFLTEKLTGLEIEAEMEAVNGQIQQAAAASGQEILGYTSNQVLSWIDGLVQDEKLELMEGNVDFDEKKLEQAGEVVISDVEITVTGAGKSLRDLQPACDHLKKEIAETFELNESSVTVNAREGSPVKAGVQKDDS